MGKMKEIFMDVRKHDRHDDDAYHYEQWKSREREQSEERILTSKDVLSDLFKKIGESYV
jgi:hypothetical protein